MLQAVSSQSNALKTQLLQTLSLEMVMLLLRLQLGPPFVSIANSLLPENNSKQLALLDRLVSQIEVVFTMT